MDKYDKMSMKKALPRERFFVGCFLVAVGYCRLLVIEHGDVLLQRYTHLAYLLGGGAANIAEMPGLICNAGGVLLPVGIAEDKAIAPAVFGEPLGGVIFICRWCWQVKITGKWGRKSVLLHRLFIFMSCWKNILMRSLEDRNKDVQLPGL